MPDGPLCSRLADLARELEVVVVGSIFEHVQDGLYFNTAVVFERDGSFLGKSRKMHIPETGPGYHEKYYFAPGDTDYPVFRTSLIDLAVPTCWDQWYPEVARIAYAEGRRADRLPDLHRRRAERRTRVDTSEPWQLVMRGHAVANCILRGRLQPGRRRGWAGLLRPQLRRRPDRPRWPRPTAPLNGRHGDAGARGAPRRRETHRSCATVGPRATEGC